jgi:pyruvate/oxaloacetate carboxyltransferase
MMNVKFGRWKNLSQPAMDIALGKYGRTPGPVDAGLLELVVKKTGQKPLSCRPADLLQPKMEALRTELAAKAMPTDNEAVVLHAMFPREFEALIRKPAATPAAPAAPAATAPAPSQAKTPDSTLASPAQRRQRLQITVNGRTREAIVEELS